MRSNLPAALALSLLLGSCATTDPAAENAVAANSETAASSQADTVATTDTATSDASSDMICRRELVTGTNFRREVCMTRAQRREIQDNSREQVIRNRNFPAETAPTQ